MRAMMKSLALLITGGMVLAFSAAPVRAEVWNFFETSCLTTDNACIVPSPEIRSLPLKIAQFSTESNGSGNYSFSANSLFDPMPTIMQTGSSFDFEWDSLLSAPGGAASTTCFFGCQWNVTFASSATDGLSLSVSYAGSSPEVNFFIGAGGGHGGGVIGSDGEMPGCGFFATCVIAGYWTTSSVPLPEPSSLTGLASAMLGFYLVMLMRSSGNKRPRSARIS